MDCGYDEAIIDNVFYQTLLRDYRELFLKCVSEDCLLCVPRAGSVSQYSLTMEDFCAHILIRNVELPESHFFNVNGEEVRINNRVITVDHEVGFQSSIHILFEETFYTVDDLKYKVLCIEKPINGKKNISDNKDRIIVLRTLRECIDFLWLESGSPDIVEKINQLTNEFLKQNYDIDHADLQTIIELTKTLYIKCVQVALKCQRVRQRVECRKNLIPYVKLAVETCMQHSIYNKIIRGISTYTGSEDAHLNKILRNMSNFQIQDLDIRTDLYGAVSNAKFELSKIDGYSTVLGKSECLKKMLLTISNCSKSNNAIVGADDILQILIFLIIKIGLPNWYAQLKYLKFFKFSATPGMHDEVSFLITSLEAALEHIQSGILINTSLKSGKDTEGAQRIKIIKYKSPDEPSLLHELFRAISVGALEEVKSILQKGKHNESDILIELCHPLCICQKCKSLTSRHKDDFLTVHSCDSQGLTPLHIASMYCKSTVVEFLLSEGADPKKTDVDGLTAMHYAAMRGDQNGLLLLAYAGADINAVDFTLNTPLHFCSNNGHESSVKALIYFCENSAIKLNINAQNFTGDTPLHKSSTWGYLNIVEILMENGADPTIRNKRKLSSIDVAHNSNIIERLTRPLGEIPNYVRVIPSKTMFDYLEDSNQRTKQKVRGVYSNSKEVHKKLEKTLRAISDGDVNLACFYMGLDAEPEINSVLDEGGRCHPLCQCSVCAKLTTRADREQKKKSAVAPLNINACNAEGLTPLHMAAMQGRADLCQILVRNGAKLNVQTRTELQTPLMLACQEERADIVKILLKSGCDIDMQDYEGSTALHYACRTRNTKIVEALIQYDPDLNLKTYQNKTALQEAKENMFIGVLKVLKKTDSLDGISGIVS